MGRRKHKNKANVQQLPSRSNTIKIAIGIVCIILVLAILVIAHKTLTPPATAEPEMNEDGTQTVRMRVTGYGYEPSKLTAKAGEPITWVIEGTDSMGCAQFLVSQELGVSRRINKGENRIELGTLEPGTYEFACSMNMFRGSITVV